MCKSNHLFYFCFFILLLCPYHLSGQNDAALLKILDKTINERPHYQKELEKDITRLSRQLFFHENTPLEQFQILGDLFHIYRSYKVDRAFNIAEQRIKLAATLNDSCRRKALMNKADALNKMGYYNEALSLLNEIPDSKEKTEDEYCNYLHHTIYLSLYNEGVDLLKKDEYRKKLIYYTRTATETAPKDSHRHLLNYSMLLKYKGMTDKAISLLETAYSNHKTDPNDKASIEYTLGNLYLENRDTARARHYLTLSSITDLKNTKKVYMSLQQLAMILFYQGDIKRADNYISCAIEDISFAKARYRFDIIAGYLPIINAANDVQIRQEKQVSAMLIAVLSLISLCLIIAFFLIHKKNQKLKAAKEELKIQNFSLQEATEHLAIMNRQIKEKDHIKEEYIGMLFNICSEYIQKQQALNKQLNRIATSGHLSDLSKFLNEQHGKSEDLKQFIHKFDSIFLSIFPDFVEKFNTLLREEERIQPKEGEVLTPELRIYALLRLGISDNSKIASFLHYSLQTVYNYRMKMRNKAISDKKDLEVQIFSF